MRLALLATPLHAEIQRYGGGPLTDLVLALQARGHEITVLSSHEANETIDTQLAGMPARLVPAKLREPGCYLLDKVFKYLSGERKIASDARRITQFLQDRGPFDAVWAIAEAPDGLAAGLAKKALFRRNYQVPPLLISVQAVRWATKTPAQSLKPERIRYTHVAGLKRGFRRADLVAANSALAERWLRQYYGVPAERTARWEVNLSEEFLRLYEGPNPEPAAPDAPIVFFGAMNPTKAPDLFLQAAIHLIEDTGLIRRIVMIGGETEKNPGFAHKLKTLQAHPALRDRLELLGRLPLEEIMPRLRTAAVIVCPSRSDTFSRAALEALVLGTPVVTSTHVGAREILEEELSGQVSPLEPHALAQAMQDVLSQREKIAEFARASAGKLVAQHAPAAAAQRIEELLLSLQK